MNKKQNPYKKLSPLKPLKKLKLKKWVGFDCETYGEYNKFYMVTFYCDDFEKVFYSRKKAIKFIKVKAKAGYTFIATNLQFDYGALFDTENKFYMKKTKFIQSGSLYIKHTLEYKHYKVEFHDTLAFFPANVKKLGDIVGTPKLDPPFPLGRKPKNNKEKKELEKYCLRDSEISYRYMIYQQNGLKSEKIKEKNTISSTSLEIFKRNYIDRSYIVESIDIIKTIFKGYYGGRTEVFKRGTFEGVKYDKKLNKIPNTKAKITYYDYNSLYPAQMYKEEFPDPNTGFYFRQGSEDLIFNYHGVTEVKIYIPKCYIPVLPYRDPKTKRLIFPCGVIKGHWTNIEIREAVRQGAKIIQVYEGVAYKGTCRPFKKYVGDIYKKRLYFKNKNDPIEKWYKLLLNSLYGKFAYRYFCENLFIPIEKLTAKQIEENSQIIDESLINDEQKTGFVTIKSEDNWENPPSYLINIWSCYTTAYGRLKLYEILGDKKLQPYICYCDTDSVFLHSGKILPTSDKLGELKLEGAKNRATFVRPKNYTFGSKVKIKGVQGKIKVKDFFNILQKGKVHQINFIKLRTAFKSRSTGKRGILKLNQKVEKDKEINFNDTKRDWGNKDFKYNVFGYTEIIKPQDSRPHFIDYYMKQ